MQQNGATEKEYFVQSKNERLAQSKISVKLARGGKTCAILSDPYDICRDFVQDSLRTLSDQIFLRAFRKSRVEVTKVISTAQVRQQLLTKFSLVSE